MNWKLFFQRDLKFAKKLKRLHHSNAILFLLLSITGLILVSASFRSTFPATRVWIKDLHIWIGLISILPLLFYLPKITKHLTTLRKRKDHRINLYLVLGILIVLIVSGVILSFPEAVTPVISSNALLIHDVATWIGIPYVIYHSITRSQWFKNLLKNPKTIENEKPIVIRKSNPFVSRRTFLKFAAGGVTAIISIGLLGNWIRSYLPSWSDVSKTLSKENDMKPIPAPQHDVLSAEGRRGTFRYYTVTETPTFSNENWVLSIEGLVDNKMQFNWQQFLELKRKAQLSDFHCVTGWSVYDVTWEGIPLKELLDSAGIQSAATYVKFSSGDGVYTEALSLEQALADDIMVAVLIDGELISQENGGPVRLVTPKHYAYKSVKWLTKIELLDHEHIGYWVERGYDQNAFVKK
ncbi:molybdopterin-dependent oxidoreductase [Gracilibacillus massiliensis]|uniref:molybdopterin-dependent oxidoreductase n=1 Tax=Gracilibacillus massiliensis TaxID=1564956 RepID=UPI00071E22F5|nr:molybdopterin-dependent oxidoreductase [Gracilibacillus massiliensis]